ncbi:MAG: hypothetical protein A3J80_01980 [Desulfobacula sp. RIFOXYB2_FULL_45_6]|nr:MAG: hypothetical protein A3J80_01980 [Desulfobacula sp. RIFOXYB2_FULL_45_6]
MTSAKIKSLLQRINFIEADMDIQKQILVSIPSNNKKDIESTIRKIADQKEQIHRLRLEIKTTDEAEYNRIMAIEQGAETFRRISQDKKFVFVNTLNESGACFIVLNDGTRMDCLVTAKEENGNWTVLTLDGETKEYPGGLIE